MNHTKHYRIGRRFVEMQRRIKNIYLRTGSKPPIVHLEHGKNTELYLSNRFGLFVPTEHKKGNIIRDFIKPYNTYNETMLKLENAIRWSEFKEWAKFFVPPSNRPTIGIGGNEENSAVINEFVKKTFTDQ